MSPVIQTSGLTKGLQHAKKAIKHPIAHLTLCLMSLTYRNDNSVWLCIIKIFAENDYRMNYDTVNQNLG